MIQKMLNRTMAAFCIVAVAAFALVALPPSRPVQAQFSGQANVATAVQGGGSTANAQLFTMPNLTSYNSIKGIPITLLSAFGANTGPVTININNLGAVPLKRIVTNPGLGYQNLGPAGLLGGVTTTIVYDTVQFTLSSPNDLTPVGSTIEMRALTAGTPVGYVVEDGSCVSRTIYQTLFVVIGTTYGACDGSTTFALPDSRGTVFAALDNQGSNGTANRITTAGGNGCSGQALGVCGAQSQTLTQPQLPVQGLTFTGNAVTPTFSGNAQSTSFTGTNQITAVTTVSGNIVSANSVSDKASGPDSTSYSVIGGNGSTSGFQGSTGFFTPNGSVGVSTPTGSISSITPSGSVSSFGGGQAHPILNPVSFGTRAVKF